MVSFAPVMLKMSLLPVMVTVLAAPEIVIVSLLPVSANVPLVADSVRLVPELLKLIVSLPPVMLSTSLTPDKLRVSLLPLSTMVSLLAVTVKLAAVLALNVTVSPLPVTLTDPFAVPLVSIVRDELLGEKITVSVLPDRVTVSFVLVPVIVRKLLSFVREIVSPLPVSVTVRTLLPEAVSVIVSLLAVRLKLAFADGVNTTESLPITVMASALPVMFIVSPLPVMVTVSLFPAIVIVSLFAVRLRAALATPKETLSPLPVTSTVSFVPVPAIVSVSLLAVRFRLALAVGAKVMISPLPVMVMVSLVPVIETVSLVAGRLRGVLAPSSTVSPTVLMVMLSFEPVIDSVVVRPVTLKLAPALAITTVSLMPPPPPPMLITSLVAGLAIVTVLFEAVTSIVTFELLSEETIVPSIVSFTANNPA